MFLQNFFSKLEKKGKSRNFDAEKNRSFRALPIFRRIANEMKVFLQFDNVDLFLRFVFHSFRFVQ